MFAATFETVGSIAVVEKAAPVILEATDALVEVELAGLCGSDLHPYWGRELGIESGTTMGHEFTGTIIDVGEDVRRFQRGDRVLSPFSTSCGICSPCERQLSSRCHEGSLFGWIEDGKGLEGAQAERVRVPLADGTLVKRPRELSAIEALLLGDVFTTGAFAVERGPGLEKEWLAVIGLGAVGLCSVLAARRAGAERIIGIDRVPERLELAASLGADPLPLPVPHKSGSEALLHEAVTSEIRRRGGGDGTAMVVEAVGSPTALELAAAVVRPGGFLSVAGVHPESQFSVSPPLAYDKNLTFAMGRCPVRSHIERLCQLQIDSPLPLDRLVSHRVPLTQAADIYRQFSERADGCVKAVFELDG